VEISGEKIGWGETRELKLKITARVIEFKGGKAAVQKILVGIQATIKESENLIS